MKLTSLLSCVKASFKSALIATEKEVIIKAPWGKIAALTWGNSTSPAVLLCHGRQDACSGFRPLLQLLPDCFFYVAVDLPGHGRSDTLPLGPKLSVMDLVPTVAHVMEHFDWERFIFIGHSLGVLIVKHFVMAYPDVVSRLVELDGFPAYLTTSQEDWLDWYHSKYGDHYSVDGYKKYLGGLDAAPKYTYDKALETIMKIRSINREAAVQVLERVLVPAGDGLCRFNYDRRLIMPGTLPMPSDYLKDIYTSFSVPILAILSTFILESGIYDLPCFIKDERQWPNKNYKFYVVDGSHDVHIDKPHLLSDYVSKFLLDDLKEKDA